MSGTNTSITLYIMEVKIIKNVLVTKKYILRKKVAVLEAQFFKCLWVLYCYKERSGPIWTFNLNAEFYIFSATSGFAEYQKTNTSLNKHLFFAYLKKCNVIIGLLHLYSDLI